MSFIKVTDPKKREALIKDFIETRKRIKDNFVARKVGEIEYQRGLTKLFKPVTETQKATAKEITEAQKATAEKITSELLPIKESIKGLPGAISFPAYPALEMTEEETEKEKEEEKEEEKKDVGSLAMGYLTYAMGKDSDRTFGIYPDENNKPKIGSKRIIVKDNDIMIDDKTYPGTPGLWELIVNKNLPKKEYTEEDYLNYGRILKQTNAIYQGNKPNTRPKSNKGEKWANLISPIWEEIKPKPEEKGGKGGKGGKGKGGRKKRQEDPTPSTSGTGLTILPNDPNALIERFDLLLASQNAGHTGVRNELVSIFDELKRQGVINMNTYKILNSIIKK